MAKPVKVNGSRRARPYRRSLPRRRAGETPAAAAVRRYWREKGDIRMVSGKTNEMRPIRALDTPNYTLISFDSDELAHIGDNLGVDLSGFDGALVDASDGDYNEVWRFRWDAQPRKVCRAGALMATEAQYRKRGYSADRAHARADDGGHRRVARR